ncbi:MAG: hypothetical protein O3C51_06955 [Planctomycetota bacterium]|nr:hypothetical protein [Planctomycetota bacterium]
MPSSALLDKNRRCSILARVDASPCSGRYSQVATAVAGLGAPELRQVMQALVDRYDARLRQQALPASVEAECRVSIARIASDLGKLPDAHFALGQDVFVKDLAIAAQRLFPAGAQSFHRSGVPRSALVEALSPSGMVRGLRFFARVGGFKPWFAIHTHTPDLAEFHEDGWRAMYRRIAATLRRHQDVLGVFGSSWFFDPRVADFSPRLAYLRSIPVEHGALSLRLRRDATSVELATAKSATRRRLVAEGQYRPNSYLLAWHRDDLIRWSDSAN